MDDDNEDIVTRRLLEYNTDKDFGNLLIKLYTHEIQTFYPELQKYTDSQFTTVYKDGAFRSQTIKTVFKNASDPDLYSFLNFVSSFPAKYMGKNSR